MKRIFGKALCFLLVMMHASALFSQNGLPDLIPYRKGNKWGFCDRNKKMVIQVSFDEVEFFGAIPFGSEIQFVPDSLAWVKKGDKEYYINKKGKQTALNAKGRDVYEEKIDAPYDLYKRVFIDPVTGKKGLRSEKGKKDTLLPAIFEDINCMPTYRGNHVRVKENGKWGIMQLSSQKWLLSPAYEKIVWDNVEDNNGKEIEIFRMMDKGMWGAFIDDTVVLPVKYKAISLSGYLVSKYFFKVQTNAGWGIADLSGKMLTTTTYEALESPDTGMCQAKRNGRWGLVSSNGKEVIACKYERTWWVTEQGLCGVIIKGKAGYVNLNGTEYFED